MGENHFAAMPLALYGCILLMAALAYWLLQQAIIATEGPDSTLRRAVGNDWKGKLSPICYFIAIFAAFHAPWITQAMYALVALIWLVPDRRIETALRGGGSR